MSYKVAIVGATGEVGRAFLKVLEERNFPISELYLFASERSEGKTLTFKGESLKVQQLPSNPPAVDIALFSAGNSVSKEFAPLFVREGAIVIDNSSAFRLSPDVPLVVPEVNPDDVKEHMGIIANPNCSTIQMVVALWPIYKKVGIKAIVVSTYQSVSGAGSEAIEELKRQTGELLQNREITKSVFPRRIAMNVFPQVDSFDENLYTREELKMLFETRKIFHDPNIRVSATCVRVPVFYGHSEAINIHLGDNLSPNDAKELLSKAPSVIVADALDYPTPIDVAGKDEVFVGRIRRDMVFDPGLSMWVVADNIRKGAATNAVQIAELLHSLALV
ncbi:MAG: aspartate-semialdehyde dehydrogenase [Aquificaceae bacterium]|nr:aspartate-semialdehyde dehydrogenase [Aquificaceae bacterium]MDW8237158.1 aspartate-semialdehyde dehydrogenase [Aquificaceae bacterium]